MSEMSIGEVAARTGIPASTLRYYEQIGLLPAPRRENSQRRYGPEVLRLLALIQVAKQASFSLTEIRDLLVMESPVAEGWRAIAARKMAEADAMIERANQIKATLVAGMACTCTDLESCDLAVGF